MNRWGSLHDELKAQLSPEAFRELIAKFAGRIIRVPVVARETEATRARVLKLLSDGKTYKEAAENAGIARSTAFKYANERP